MTFRTLARAIAATVVCGAGNACVHDTAAPPAPGRTLGVVAGADQRDTITAILPQALIVEVHGDDGRPLPGAGVRFDALPTDDSTRSGESAIALTPLTGSSFGSTSSDFADGFGRAKALVRLGTITGAARIVISVPAFGLSDTVSYSVAPGHAARVAMPNRDTTIFVNATVSVGARAADRYGNERPGDTVRYSAAASAVTVNAAGQVTGNAPARAAIAVWVGAAVDSFRVSIVPRGTIVVVAEVTPHVNPASYQIATVDLDGSNFRAITSVGIPGPVPRLSPAGDHLLFHESVTGQGTRLFIADLAGNRRQLTPMVADTSDEAFGRYSPDGVWVYFSRAKRNPERTDLYRIRSDGTGLDKLSPAVARSSYLSGPCLSADGTTLLYVDGSLGASSIRSMNVATRAVTALDVPGVGPHFSPDGQHIAYVDEFFGYLRLMGADGSDQHPITTATIYGESGNFSPDGQWIVIRGGVAFNPSDALLVKLQLVRVSDGFTIPLSYSTNFHQPSFKP